MGGTLSDLFASDPQQALKLLRELKGHQVIPHAGGQQEVMDHPARFKVLNCGRRWGKTKIGVKSMIEQVLMPPEPNKKERLCWWVAPTYRVVKRGYAETLRQLPRSLLAHDPPPETNFDAGRSVTLRLKNGNKIEFYSAERPGGMLGEGVDYAVVDEAATIPSTVWEQVIRPTLMDTKGGGMLISTPRGRNWFYKRHRDGQRDERQWKSWTFTSYDNPTLDPQEVEDMKAELPSLIFAQEVLAKFIADGSSVFQWPEKAEQGNLVLDNHLIEDSPPNGQVFLGIDLAKTTDYTVLYGANETGMNNVYFERFTDLRWKEQKRRIRRAVRSLENNGAESVTLVMDSTGVGDPIVEDMEDDGYDVIGINFTNTKNKMVTKLAKDLETGKAMVLGDYIQEFEDYQMSTTKAGRMVYSAPEGDHDDVVSAKMLQHWGITTEGSPNVVALGGAEDPQDPELRPKDEDDPEFADDDRTDWSDLLDDDMSIEELVARPGRFSGVGPRSPRVVEPPTPAAQPSPEDIFAQPDAWS